MMERMARNWTITRAMYLTMGIIVMIQAVISHQWVGLAFGGYFAAMGLFAFGCAAGNCTGGNCKPVTQSSGEDVSQERYWEEVT